MTPEEREAAKEFMAYAGTAATHAGAWATETAHKAWNHLFPPPSAAQLEAQRQAELKQALSRFMDAHVPADATRARARFTLRIELLDRTARILDVALPIYEYATETPVRVFTFGAAARFAADLQDESAFPVGDVPYHAVYRSRAYEPTAPIQLDADSFKLILRQGAPADWTLGVRALECLGCRSRTRSAASRRGGRKKSIKRKQKTPHKRRRA